MIRESFGSFVINYSNDNGLKKLKKEILNLNKNLPIYFDTVYEILEYPSNKYVYGCVPNVAKLNFENEEIEMHRLLTFGSISVVDIHLKHKFCPDFYPANREIFIVKYDLINKLNFNLLDYLLKQNIPINEISCNYGKEEIENVRKNNGSVEINLKIIVSDFSIKHIANYINNNWKSESAKEIYFNMLMRIEN